MARILDLNMYSAIVIPFGQSCFFLLTSFGICFLPLQMPHKHLSQLYVDGISWLWLSSVRVMKEPCQGKGQGRTSRILFLCLAKSCFLPFMILFLSICTLSQMPSVPSWRDRAFAVKVLPGITTIGEMKCSTRASISHKDQKIFWFLFSGILGDFYWII